MPRTIAHDAPALMERWITLPAPLPGGANHLSASSLRTQGPIATGSSLAKSASSISLEREHNAVWVPAQGRDDVELVSDSIVKQREDVRPRSRGAVRPSFASISPSEQQEGAGKAGCALHPRSRVQHAQGKTHTSIQVQRRHSGLPRAMVLRLISRSPWRPGFLATVASRALPQSLTPASGRRDHTTSPYAIGSVRLTQLSRPPHPTARS